MKYVNSILISKPKFFILSLKRNILPILFCIFTACLIIFSKSNLNAAKIGLTLWANSVVPSLLPFFIATELLSYTNIVFYFSKILDPIMRPLFNVPGCGAYALIMGIISGYPIGAKIITNFRQNNLCTAVEAERLLSFTNNSGPLFIIGTVGISMFGNSTIGLLLLITHILSCLTVGFLFRFWKSSYKNNSTYDKLNETNNNFNSKIKKSLVSFSNLGEVLSKSISSSIGTIVIIGGFIVLFSVILSILEKSSILILISNLLYPIFKTFGINNINFVQGLLSGFLELTNGVKLISTIPYKEISVNIILCAFLLGFGGISIFFQVFSIISKLDISIKPYFLGKLIQGLIAAFYTLLFIKFFPIFNLNL